MKITLSFFVTMTDEIDGIPEKLHSEDEIKEGLIETLKEICTDNATVSIENINVNYSGL